MELKENKFYKDNNNYVHKIIQLEENNIVTFQYYGKINDLFVGNIRTLNLNDYPLLNFTLLKGYNTPLYRILNNT